MTPPRLTRALLGLVAVAVVAGGVLWLRRPQPVAVTVAEAASGDVLATVANTRAGTVDACNRARMAPPTGGQIARLPVREGQAVQRGAVLLELWNEDLRAQVSQAERDAVAVRSRAREACITADVAERNAARIRRVRADNLVSEGEADRATGEADAQAAACAAARDQERVSAARIDVARAGLERTILRQRFPGVVRRVAPYVLDVEKQARTVEVEAEIEDPEKYDLLPGYSADVEVILENRAGVLRVPTQAVLDGNRVFVFDAATGRLAARSIERGVANWEYTEVRKGLAAGELVVTSVDRAGVADGAAAVRE